MDIKRFHDFIEYLVHMLFKESIVRLVKFLENKMLNFV